MTAGNFEETKKTPVKDQLLYKGEPATGAAKAHARHTLSLRTPTPATRARVLRGTLVLTSSTRSAGKLLGAGQRSGWKANTTRDSESDANNRNALFQRREAATCVGDSTTCEEDEQNEQNEVNGNEQARHRLPSPFVVTIDAHRVVEAGRITVNDLLAM